MDLIIQEAEREKLHGNQLYKLSQFAGAIACYQSGVQYLDEEDPAYSEMLAVLFGNISACYMSLEDFETSLQYCERSLIHNP